LRLDSDAGLAPVLSVFGGKITTYRKLAEHALDKLQPWFPAMRASWTAGAPLPGGDFAAGLQAYAEVDLARDWPWLSAGVRCALARRHGTQVAEVLRGVQSLADLGVHFGADLYAREVDYMIDHEWAHTHEDILYRRSKVGLHLTAAQCASVANYVAARIPMR
jgi:glycerol-3-phosphate dehydrogenase